MPVTPPAPAPAPAPVVINPSKLTINPQLIASVLAFIVTQALAFGILTPSTGQTIIAIGGIVIPAAIAIASALHLGQVHAAMIANARNPRA